MQLSQEDFGALLCVTTVTVSRWESGRTRPTHVARALIGLLQRALRKQSTEQVTDVLRSLPANDDVSRLVTLVHLGD
jgi:transcriptional regulator with XRE-family HTH domain